MSIVSDLLPTLDSARALLDDVGLRPYSVSVRVVTAGGPRFGSGQNTISETPITVAGGRRPKVKQVVDKDIVAGGLLTKSRWQVLNITPEYVGGGVAPETLDPRATGAPTEVFYVLSGPGMPPTGMLCRKVADNYDRVFGYSITIESLGKAA